MEGILLDDIAAKLRELGEYDETAWIEFSEPTRWRAHRTYKGLSVSLEAFVDPSGSAADVRIRSRHAIAGSNDDLSSVAHAGGIRFTDGRFYAHPAPGTKASYAERVLKRLVAVSRLTRERNGTPSDIAAYANLA